MFQFCRKLLYQHRKINMESGNGGISRIEHFTHERFSNSGGRTAGNSRIPGLSARINSFNLWGSRSGSFFISVCAIYNRVNPSGSAGNSEICERSMLTVFIQWGIWCPWYRTLDSTNTRRTSGNRVKSGNSPTYPFM